MKPSIYLTASQVEDALLKRFSKNGYTTLTQVRNGTGFEKRQVRTADMLAISTWPSRGLYCEGIEIKVSSSDLASEIANPKKAEEIAQYCEYWWIATPRGLSRNLTLPKNWGLIEVDENLKATTQIAAARLKAKSMDQLFVCAVFRSFAEHYVPKVHVSKITQEDVERRVKEDLHRRESRIKELEEAILEFKEHSGIDLLSEHGHKQWDTKGIGDAVKTLQGLREWSDKELGQALDSFDKGRAVIEFALKSIAGVKAGNGGGD